MPLIACSLYIYKDGIKYELTILDSSLAVDASDVSVPSSNVEIIEIYQDILFKDTALIIILVELRILRKDPN